MDARQNPIPSINQNLTIPLSSPSPSNQDPVPISSSLQDDPQDTRTAHDFDETQPTIVCPRNDPSLHDDPRDTQTARDFGEPQQIIVCSRNEVSLPELVAPFPGNANFDLPTVGSSNPSHNANEAAISLVCDVCSSKSESKNKVTAIGEEECLRAVTVEFPIMNSAGERQSTYPFKDALEAAKMHRPGQFMMFVCYRCRFQFRELRTKIGKRYEKLCKSYRNQIMNRMRKNDSDSASQEGVEHTVETSKCKLHRVGSDVCSTGDKAFYRPRMLSPLQEWAKKHWVVGYAKEVGIGQALARYIVDNVESVWLCANHRNKLRKKVDEIFTNARKCSICACSPVRRSAGKVTEFDFSRFFDDPQLRCVVEDAIAVRSNNTLRPSDVKRLCSACRVVVTRQVDAKEMVVRHLKPGSRIEGAFDHGPTPRSIRRSILSVRDELLSDKRFVVFLKDVKTRYDSFVLEERESQYRIKDVRTLKKYLLPSLACSNIHLEMGSRKVGQFFCTTKTFEDLAANSSGPDDILDQCSIPKEMEHIRTLAAHFKRCEDSFRKLAWRLSDQIRAVPTGLWFRQMRILCSERLQKRCKANAKLRQVSYDQEWPFNNEECPDNLVALPSHEFSKAVETYFHIEHQVYCASQRRARGPIITSLSFSALSNTSCSWMSMLNRIGCTTSYTTADTFRQALVAERAESGPFAKLKDGAFLVVAMDNVNIRASNSLAIHNATNRGFDGLAVQAVNPNTNYDFWKSCRDSDPSRLKPKRLGQLSRSEFIQSFPTRDDPDLTAYRWMTVGLSVLNRKRLCSLDTSNSRSLRALLLDSFTGFSRGKARIIYHSIREANPIDKVTIIQKLLDIEEQLMERYPGETIFVGVAGDQPVFKMLFDLWYDSYCNGTSLCQWMIPIPGGFHIDKQALIPTIKIYMAGACLEELVRLSGLSASQIKDFQSLANYRKNRRALHQIAAAQILRVCDVIQVSEPETARAVDQLISSADSVRSELVALDNVVRASSDSAGGAAPALREEAVKNATEAIARKEYEIKDKRKKLLPCECKLAFSSRLPPEVLAIGKLLCDTIEEKAKHSLNMKFFAKVLLLDTLIPWTAFNILTRTGQTTLNEKFWFYIVGVLHGTTKINYMENMLWYAFVKRAMPPHISDVLYNEGHLVAGERDDSRRVLQSQDELMESNCIKHSKRIRLSEAKAVEKSVAYTREFGETYDKLERELGPSRKRAERNTDVKPKRAAKKARREPRDEEKKTAVNVFHMHRFLSEKSWLGEEHLAMEHLVNPLREPYLMMTSKEDIDHIMNAEARGRIAAELHCCAKMTNTFGELSDEDIKQHFGGKALKGKWTKSAFKFKSMADLDPATAARAMRKRKRGEDANRMNKRLKQIWGVKNCLTQVLLQTNNDERKSSASTLLKEIEGHELILSSKAYAYRQDVRSDEPCSRPKSGFFRTLQQLLFEKEVLSAEDSFLRKGHRFLPTGVASIHFDVMNTVHHHPVVVNDTFRLGASIYNQCLRVLRPYLRSEKYASVCELHFHMDVSQYMPLQKKHEQERRIAARRAGRGVSTDDGGNGGEGASAEIAVLDFDSIVKTSSQKTWAALLEDRATKDFVARLHCVLSAKAAVELLSNVEGDSASTSTDGSPRDCEVFIHGAALAMSNDCVEVALGDTRFSRMEHSLLISKIGGLEAVEYPDFVVNADAYDPSCCWKVSKSGFQRWPSGDCEHAESETRMVFALSNVTRKRMLELKLPQQDWRVLIVAADNDTPFITTLSTELISFSIFHKIGETCIHVTMLRDALQKASVRIEELVLLYAMAGCDYLPATNHVSQMRYISAFLNHRDVIGELYRIDCGTVVSRYTETDWKPFENLTIAAYILSYSTAENKGMLRLQPKAVSAPSWGNKIRKWISSFSKVKCPTELIPYREDVELQSRRAVWLLKYWSHAERFSCHNKAVGGLSSECGFTEDGSVLLERAEDLMLREKAMKKMTQRCACKTGCLPNRCGCRKREIPVLCLLCSCAENCTNGGGDAEEPVPVAVEEIRDSDDDDSDEPDGGDEDQAEEESISDDEGHSDPGTEQECEE